MSRSDRNLATLLSALFAGAALAAALLPRGAGPAVTGAAGPEVGILERLFTPLGVDGDDASVKGSEDAHADPRRALPPDVRALLARRHAPELRFNAWFPMADPSDAHRTEDYLPMSVERFREAIGWDSAADAPARLIPAILERSVRDRPAVLGRVVARGRPAWRGGLLVGYPHGMPGDPDGRAPVYVDAYPDPDAPTRTAFVELWSFYPTDASDARVLLRWAEVGGHRSDWEHISLEVDISLGPERSRIVRAVYFGHEAALLVERDDLELALGTHPVVYVSQGKHASYPEAGEWRDYFGSAPWMRFDDVFHGNGLRVETWRGELVDIARAARPRLEWLTRSERWGGEDERILGVAYCTSSKGPWFHAESNDRMARVTGEWRAAKATARGLRTDRDAGLVAPRVAPPPPLRAW